MNRAVARQGTDLHWIGLNSNGTGDYSDSDCGHCTGTVGSYITLPIPGSISTSDPQVAP